MRRTFLKASIILLALIVFSCRKEDKIQQLFKQSLETKDAKEKLALREQIVKLSPRSFEGYYSQGYIQVKAGEYEKGIESFKQAVKIKPKSADGHFGLGWAYLESGSYEKAIEECKQAIKIKPEYPEVLKGLDEKKAQELLEKIEEKSLEF